VKGAFTGADRDKAGVFEEASGGTLLLDEITNASWDVQARLLRVLQEREVRRVGGSGTVPVDVRVIAATNRDPEQDVREESFREDLYYRLAVIPLHVPALRERRDDVPLLAEAVLREVVARDGKELDGFTEGALRLLQAHDWPGNVRELRNVVARMAAFCESGRVDESRVPESVARSGRGRLSVNLDAGAPAEIVERLLGGEQDFWSAVRAPLRERSITKEQARAVVAEGLTRTRGSYKKTAELFGLSASEYTRFMDFLRFNDLKLDFRPFRKPAKGS
jgi:two-component system response regulator AtoC